MGDTTYLNARTVKALPGCFFLISVGYKVVWTAISSLIAEYSNVYGPEILLYLNIAYFFPSIPVLIVQAYTIEAMDRRLGPCRGPLLRFSVGMGGLALLCLTFGTMPSLSSLLLSTVLVGMCYGVAFGTSYQVVAKFPAENTVALTTGFVSAGVVVFAFDLIIKRGATYDEAGLVRLFKFCSVQVLVGLAAAYIMVLLSWKKLTWAAEVRIVKSIPPPSRGLPASTKQPTSSLNRFRSRTVSTDGTDLEPFTALDLELNHPDAKDEDAHAKQKANSMRAVLLRIWPVACALFLSVATSMLFFPFFPYMHSTGLLGQHLHQVLFYIRLLGDICGRIGPTSWQSRDQRWLLTMSVGKSLMLPPLFLAIWMPQLVLGDLGAVTMVALFWSLSGYINTCAYLAAPLLVAPHQAGKVGSLMATTFQVACLVGLLAAYGLQKLWTATTIPDSVLEY